MSCREFFFFFAKVKLLVCDDPLESIFYWKRFYEQRLCALVLFEWKNYLTTRFLVRFLYGISLLERDSFIHSFPQKRLQHQLRTLCSQYTAWLTWNNDGQLFGRVVSLTSPFSKRRFKPVRCTVQPLSVWVFRDLCTPFVLVTQSSSCEEKGLCKLSGRASSFPRNMYCSWSRAILD